MITEEIVEKSMYFDVLGARCWECSSKTVHITLINLTLLTNDVKCCGAVKKGGGAEKIAQCLTLRVSTTQSTMKLEEVTVPWCLFSLLSL